jgi:hypothetical protein
VYRVSVGYEVGQGQVGQFSDPLRSQKLRKGACLNATKRGRPKAAKCASQFRQLNSPGHLALATLGVGQAGDLGLQDAIPLP